MIKIILIYYILTAASISVGCGVEAESLKPSETISRTDSEVCQMAIFNNLMGDLIKTQLKVKTKKYRSACKENHIWP